MPEHNVAAHLELLACDAGGLTASMQSQTPSLLLIFDSLDADHPDEVQLGAMIVTPGGLHPGGKTGAVLSFWSEMGRIYATPGITFRLWYAGRIVGTGVVLAEQGREACERYGS